MNIPDPLPKAVLLVGHGPHNVCGEVCVTGSAPAMKHFWKLARKKESLEKLSVRSKVILQKVKSNDIDIFAPMHPTKIMNCRAQDGRGMTNSVMKDVGVAKARKLLLNEMHEELNFTVFWGAMMENYGFIIASHTERRFDELGTCEDSSYFAWNEAASVGIRCMHNFKIEGLRHINIQLMLVDNLPNPGETWHRFITKRFDINIVRGMAEVGRIADLGELFFNEEVFQNINAGCFNFMIRPTMSFKGTLKQTFKHTK